MTLGVEPEDRIRSRIADAVRREGGRASGADGEPGRAASGAARGDAGAGARGPLRRGRLRPRRLCHARAGAGRGPRAADGDPRLRERADGARPRRAVVQHVPKKAPQPSQTGPRRGAAVALRSGGGGVPDAAAEPPHEPGHDPAPPPARRGAGGKRADAGKRARRLRREGRDRVRPPRPRRHDVRTRTRAGPQGVAA